MPRGRVVTPEAMLPDGVVVLAGEQVGWVGPAAGVLGRPDLGALEAGRRMIAPARTVR